MKIIGEKMFEDWPAVVTKFVEDGKCQRFTNILLSSVPENSDGRLVLKVPGGLFYEILPKKKLEEALREHYNVQAVVFVPDAELAKTVIKQTEPAPSFGTEPAPKPESPAPKPEPKFLPFEPHVTKHFSLEDNLSDVFHPKNNAYLVSPANSVAYHAISRLVSNFPEMPDQHPFVISAGIGMGKTHLLQHFAWVLIEKIREAKELAEKDDIVSARKLLNLPENEPVISARQLLQKAARTRVRYVTAEEFVDEHILSTTKDAWKGKDGNSEEYRRDREHWYLSIDWLFLDDIHAFARGEKESSLEYAYKIADRFIRAGNYLIAATDTAPQLLIKGVKKDNIRHAVDRLFSRLYSGGVYAIENPAREELADVVSNYLVTMNNNLRRVTAEELGKGSFFSVAKSYRDALSVARTAYKYALEGLTVEAAVKKGIDALKSQIAPDLFH